MDETADRGDGLPPWAQGVLARRVAAALSAGLRRAVTVSANTDAHPPLAQFEPTSRFALPNDVPVALVQFSPDLAECLLDLLLGGTGQATKPRGPLTSLDRQLLRPLVDQFSASLPIAALAATGAIDPQAEPTVVSLTVHLAEVHSPLHLAFAHGVPQLVEALLPLADEVDVVALIEEHVDLQAVAGLSAGDMLVSDTSPDGEVTVTVGGVPRFAAKLGQFDGKRAITITRRLSQ